MLLLPHRDAVLHTRCGPRELIQGSTGRAMTCRSASWAAAVVLTACGSTAIPRQPTGTPYDSAFSEQVAAGVVHRRLVAMQGPFTINVVEVDLRRRDIAVEAVHAFDSLRGRERPTAMVARVAAGTPVLAAVNADFFDLKTGENENNQVVNGEILKAVPVTDSPFDSLHTIHTQFGMTCSGRPAMERFAFTGAVLTPPPSVAVLPLQAINYRPRGDATVLYTVAYGTTPTDSDSRSTVEAPLRFTSRHGDTMFYQSAGAPHEGGGTVLSRGEAVLAGTGAAAEVVRRLGASIGPNNSLRVVGRFTPDRGRLCVLVGGWPRLVLDGRSIADSVDRLEGTFPRFSVTRHPRTGVGFSRDSTILYLFTVDGRSESISGMSLAELATLMQSLGVFQGLNLDGGGSTALVLHGVLANVPSDSTGE